MHVLITNSVPLNGGDEALLRATIESLTQRFPGCRVSACCSRVRDCRRLLPDLDLHADLEQAGEGAEGLTSRVRQGMRRRLRRLRGARREGWLASPEEKAVLDLYRRADVVVSSAGGFLHDHYPIEARLRGLEVALDLGKPVVLFAQSIGPFWKPASRRRVAEVFARLTRTCVRDELSRAHLAECGVDPARVSVTADAAFLWHVLAPELYRRRGDGPVETIATAFRSWPLGDAKSATQVVGKAAQLCHDLLADPRRRLVFVSTCQGVPGYVDDSELALRIVAALPDSMAARCRVDRTRHGPRQLIELLSGVDAFIGMRLHGAILAMLGGTPAMGIGYEPKTAELFGQMGLARFQVEHQAPADAWREAAATFLAEAQAIRAGLPDTLARLAQRALLNVDAVAEALAGTRQRTT